MARPEGRPLHRAWKIQGERSPSKASVSSVSSQMKLLARSIYQPQERLCVLPDFRQAFKQLMIVVEQGQRHVPPGGGELLDLPRIDRGVAESLKDQRRLHKC